MRSTSATSGFEVSQLGRIDGPTRDAKAIIPRQSLHPQPESSLQERERVPIQHKRTDEIRQSAVL